MQYNAQYSVFFKDKEFVARKNRVLLYLSLKLKSYKNTDIVHCIVHDSMPLLFQATN